MSQGLEVKSRNRQIKEVESRFRSLAKRNAHFLFFCMMFFRVLFHSCSLQPASGVPKRPCAAENDSVCADAVQANKFPEHGEERNVYFDRFGSHDGAGHSFSVVAHFRFRLQSEDLTTEIGHGAGLWSQLWPRTSWFSFTFLCSK